MAKIQLKENEGVLYQLIPSMGLLVGSKANSEPGVEVLAGKS